MIPALKGRLLKVESVRVGVGVAESERSGEKKEERGKR